MALDIALEADKCLRGLVDRAHDSVAVESNRACPQPIHYCREKQIRISQLIYQAAIFTRQ